MRKKTRKKLTLTRETIKLLDDDALGSVAGGCSLSKFFSICDTDCDCDDPPDGPDSDACPTRTCPA